MTEIPGLPASHQIITDDCRSGRTDAGAFDEAVARIRREYDAILGHDQPLGTKLRLVLFIERPK